MKVAYADPPYLGQARRYYADHPEHAQFDTLVGHANLIERLCVDYPDGWALSASSTSLRHLLQFCPGDCRIAAWVKSFCAFKRGVRPAYAWESVIFRGGRNRNHPPPPKNGKQTTPKDFIVEPITLKRGLVGAKPDRVCDWILNLLNVQPSDDVHDLFPGTGGMGRAVQRLRDGGD